MGYYSGRILYLWTANHGKWDSYGSNIVLIRGVWYLWGAIHGECDTPNGIHTVITDCELQNKSLGQLAIR